MQGTQRHTKPVTVEFTPLADRFSRFLVRDRPRIAFMAVIRVRSTERPAFDAMKIDPRFWSGFFHDGQGPYFRRGNRSRLGFSVVCRASHQATSQGQARPPTIVPEIVQSYVTPSIVRVPVPLISLQFVKTASITSAENGPLGIRKSIEIDRLGSQSDVPSDTRTRPCGGLDGMQVWDVSSMSICKPLSRGQSREPTTSQIP